MKMNNKNNEDQFFPNFNKTCYLPIFPTNDMQQFLVAP